MSRNLTIAAVAAGLLLIPAQLLAGGPARLCIPVDGVTADNAEVCAQRIANALGDRIWLHSPRRGVKLEQHDDQWYALFYLAWMDDLQDDVKLSDIAAALEGSGFSVPRDKLRLFGPARLELDVRSTAHEELMSDLAALEHVRIDASKRKNGILLATVIMPYNVTRDIFRSLNSAKADSTQSDLPTRRELPSHAALREVVDKHDGRVNDICWSSHWACRMLGCVAGADIDTY